MIDTKRNVKAAEVSLCDLRGLYFPPDRSLGVALAKQTVLVRDGATGSELARPSGFVSPVAIVFDAAR